MYVFISSVTRRASVPVSFVPLGAHGLAQGSNAFTLSRFLVASLCDFQGRAIFCDGSDMVMLADIAELDALFDPRYAVQVVKHLPYISRHKRKYIGVESMECEQTNYWRKNWASVMLINCEHEAWPRFTANVGGARKLDTLQLSFLPNDQIGALPLEWNVIVDEGQLSEDAKLLHWTAGVPFFETYRDAPSADVWRKESSFAFLGVEG